jgi:hypothetical protein
MPLFFSNLPENPRSRRALNGRGGIQAKNSADWSHTPQSMNKSWYEKSRELAAGEATALLARGNPVSGVANEAEMKRRGATLS